MDIEITINDKKIMTKSGITILEAASQVGIKIPTLCYLKRLRPIGSCRICSVEVKGVKNPLPSCVAKVKEGYEISTDTKKVWKVRNESLSHLLLDHPIDCPVCDKSGECSLQDLTFEFGLTRQENKKIFPDRTNIFKSDLIEYMATRCVLCSRCIRVCTDMYGNPFLQIKDKGYNGYIGLKIDDKYQIGSVPAENCSFEEIKSDKTYLDCYYCGNCIEVCPVGALISKPSKFKERYWQESPFSSVCDKCSAACRIEYYRYGKEEFLVRTASLFGGYLCRQGFFYEGIGKNDGYYIQSPLIRKKSFPEETDRAGAISEFVRKIKKIYEKNEMKNTAVLVSPNVSTNDGFVISNFARDILKPGYFDISESGFYRDNFNRYKTIFKNEESFDIKTLKNSDTILYIGSIEDEIPYVAYNVMKTRRENGAKIIFLNINEFKSGELSRFKDIAHIQKDIKLTLLHDFLNDLRQNIYQNESSKKEDENVVLLSSIADDIIKADCISILIGDYPMSAYDMGKDILTIKEIVEFLRDAQKIVYIYPLIKPFNYRGLMDAGVNPVGLSGYNSIYEGIESGNIKNLIYIGDTTNSRANKELIKYAADLEFLAVFSSKSGILSAMADVVIPIYDFIESRDSFYENFEGKKLNLTNEFNLGPYRSSVLSLLTEISYKLGSAFNYINEELEGFLKTIKANNVISYNRFKAKSKFYYNDNSKTLY